MLSIERSQLFPVTFSVTTSSTLNNLKMVQMLVQ